MPLGATYCVRLKTVCVPTSPAAIPAGAAVWIGKPTDGVPNPSVVSMRVNVPKNSSAPTSSLASADVNGTRRLNIEPLNSCRGLMRQNPSFG
jgi:hypothetical protein